MMPIVGEMELRRKHHESRRHLVERSPPPISSRWFKHRVEGRIWKRVLACGLYPSTRPSFRSPSASDAGIRSTTPLGEDQQGCESTILVSSGPETFCGVEMYLPDTWPAASTWCENRSARGGGSGELGYEIDTRACSPLTESLLRTAKRTESRWSTFA